MAEDLARENISLSLPNTDKPELAFKFEQGEDKYLLLSTIKENGARFFHITLHEGRNKRKFKYSNVYTAVAFVNAYVKEDPYTTGFEHFERRITFKLISFDKDKSNDSIDIFEFVYVVPSLKLFKNFLAERLPC